MPLELEVYLDTFLIRVSSSKMESSSAVVVDFVNIATCKNKLLIIGVESEGFKAACTKFEQFCELLTTQFIPYDCSFQSYSIKTHYKLGINLCTEVICRCLVL